MAQQTAVEWLIEQLEKQVYRIDHKDNRIIPISFDDIIEIQKQAKAMEKEQIIKAASNDRVFQIAKYLVDGEESNLSLFEWRNTIKRDAEQYYNETYKK